MLDKYNRKPQTGHLTNEIATRPEKTKINPIQISEINILSFSFANSAENKENPPRNVEIFHAYILFT